MNTSTLINMLSVRLQDPDNSIFTDSYLISELNVAQTALCMLVSAKYLENITVTDEEVVFDENGELLISNLDNSALSNNNSILKVFLLRVESSDDDGVYYKVAPARSVNEHDIGKTFKNIYYEGTYDNPIVYVKGDRIKVYSGPMKVVSSVPAEAGGNYTVAARSTRVLSSDNDEYNEYYLVSQETGEYYEISDYDGATHEFTVGELEEADMANTDWYLIPPDKESYCGAGLVTYIKEPTELDYDSGTGTDVACDLDNSLIQPLLLMAESDIWGSDGKVDRANNLYQRAMSAVSNLNQAVRPSDAVGAEERR